MLKPESRPVALPENLPVSLNYRHKHLESGFVLPQHFHDLCEIVVFEQVGGQVFFDGQEVDVSGGQVMFIPAQTVHGFNTTPGQTTSYALHFEARAIARIDPDLALPRRALVTTPHPEDFTFLLSTLHWVERAGASSPVASARALQSALSIFFEKICQPETGIGAGVPAFQQLERYLNEHNIYRLSVDQAASISHLSRSHFMAKFKRAYGMTFNQYMLQRTIQAARYLLRAGELSITEIAHEMQLNNASYFSKLFRKEVGCTPRTYTRLHTHTLQ